MIARDAGVERGGRRWAMGSDSARGPFARFPGFRAVETPRVSSPARPGKIRPCDREG